MLHQDLPDQPAPSIVSSLEAVFARGPSPPPLYGVDAIQLTDGDIARTLAWARAHDIRGIQKGLFYSYVTTHHFEEGKPDNVGEAKARWTVSKEDSTRARSLLDALHTHFSPLLFQAPAGAHMNCTDALAESWMTTVIPEAMAADGLSRPLETLQTWIDADWSSRAVCGDCQQTVKDEWRSEQASIWGKIGSWLGLPELDA